MLRYFLCSRALSVGVAIHQEITCVCGERRFLSCLFQPTGRCPRFLLVIIQLGLHLQVGQDVTAVKDDVSALKDCFKSVKEGMDLYQASPTISRKQQIHGHPTLTLASLVFGTESFNRVVRFVVI